MSSPSFVSVVDRHGVRWTKFNTLYAFANDAESTKNAARDLAQRVSARNAVEYGQLELDDDARVLKEQRTAKYVNDSGVSEYCCYVDGEKRAAIRAALRLQNDAVSRTAIAISRESVSFVEDEFSVNDTFATIRIGNSEVWIEGLKLCRAFEYVNPWNVLENYVYAADKRKYSEFCSSSNITMSLENSKNLSPDTVFVNKAAVIGISQRSNKPLLKRFWHRMNRELSERYDFVYSTDDDEMFAVPKPVSTDEPMEVDGANYKIALLEAKLRASEAEKQIIDYKGQLLVKDLEKQMLQERCEFRELRAMYAFGVRRTDAVDAAFVDTLTESATERARFDGVRRALRGEEYAVARSISDVNPSKESVIALVWYRARGTYSAVRQIRESFDKQFKYHVVDAQSKVLHRVTGAKPRCDKDGLQVLVGRAFTSHNAQQDWTRFKDAHPHVMFGVQFVNHALVEFRPLSRDELSVKYEKYRSYVETGYDADTDANLSRNQAMVVNYYVGLFRKIGVTDADECVARCYVPDVWHLYAFLLAQMNRDHLAEIEKSAAAATTTTVAAAAGTRNSRSDDSSLMPPHLRRQFANLETISAMDPRHGDVYDELLEFQRLAAAAASSSMNEKFFDDLRTKRQSNPRN